MSTLWPRSLFTSAPHLTAEFLAVSENIPQNRNAAATGSIRRFFATRSNAVYLGAIADLIKGLLPQQDRNSHRLVEEPDVGRAVVNDQAINQAEQDLIPPTQPITQPIDVTRNIQLFIMDSFQLVTSPYTCGSDVLYKHLMVELVKNAHSWQATYYPDLWVRENGGGQRHRWKSVAAMQKIEISTTTIGIIDNPGNTRAYIVTALVDGECENPVAFELHEPKLCCEHKCSLRAHVRNNKTLSGALEGTWFPPDLYDTNILEIPLDKAYYAPRTNPAYLKRKTEDAEGTHQVGAAVGFRTVDTAFP